MDNLLRFLLIASLAVGGPGILAEERAALRPVESLGGTLLLHGGGDPGVEFVEFFWSNAGKEKARIVEVGLERSGSLEQQKRWRDHDVDAARYVAAGSRSEAEEHAPLLEGATAVWFRDFEASKYEAVFGGTSMARRVRALMERGGAVAGIGGGAAFLAAKHVRSVGGSARAADGLAVLKSCVVLPGQSEVARKASIQRMLAELPGFVAYAIEERTALLARGRTMIVRGEGSVTVSLAPSSTRGAREDRVGEGGVLDLVAMSRAAIARCRAAHPPAVLPPPRVTEGTLVIVGGGMTPEITRRFVDAAGGVDAARIVVIPTAMGEPASSRAGHDRYFRAAGVRHVSVVHAANRREADDKRILDTLARATGIWFSGGRQWRLVDSYLGTRAEKLMHDVVRRGGVIGGSSAGATIQADYLVRGNPLGNREMMSEGYERGLGFIRGIAIDQHFTQRDRFADMEKLKKSFPQLIGLGIDERTAVVVRGHILEVVGRHRVALYDRKDSSRSDVTEYKSLEAGERYDFATGRVLREF